MSQIQPGEKLGAYQIVSQVGKGGMATVYKAFHPATNRFVAIKVLPETLADNPEFINRFRQEVQTIANLQHPQILPVFDYGEDGGRMYMVMRFLDTGTLKERMQKHLSLAEIDRLFSQLLAALDYAHMQNIIHRDIKPANALVDAQDNLFLTDFGIAKILEKQTKFTETGAMIGTPDYMSPEQAQGMHLDRRSDIYSLGIILYEMVTGHVPFEAETPLAVILKHIHDPLPPPSSQRPGLTPEIEAVILKALAKKPEDRFANCGEFLRAWQAAVRAANGSLTVDTPASATGTRIAVSAPTAGVAGAKPVGTKPPATGGGNRDLLIVLGLGGVLLTIVCLLVAAGLGGLSLLSGRLGQAATPTRGAAATQEAGVTRVVENTPPPDATLAPVTEEANPTESVATAGPASLVEAVNISNTQYESEYPQIVLDEQGLVNVIWSDKTERKEGDVYYAHFTRQSTWTLPERISSGSGVLVGGSLRWVTKPDGARCAIWYSLEWVQRCLTDGGWTQPEGLNVEASWSEGPAFAYAPDGTLAVAWYQFNNVYYNGTVISDGRDSVHDLRMVLDDDGNPHVAWMEQDSGQFVLKAHYSEDGGTNWDDIATLSTDDSAPGLGAAFDLAADVSGTVHAAWASQSGHAYYAPWTYEGGWGSPEELTGGLPLSDLSLITDANSHVHLVGSGLVGTQRGIMYFEHTEAGWSAAQLIAEDTGEISIPSRNARIVVDDDDVRHIVWQSANSTPDIFYAKLP